MSNRTSGLEEVELSDLIGEIYDCVIDPTRWERTLDRLRGLLDCTACKFVFADLRNATTRMKHVAGLEAEWDAQFPAYAADAAAMMVSVPDLVTRALDEPFVGRRDIPEAVRRSNRYWREWIAPQGFVDFIALRLMQGPDGVTDIAYVRHEDVGPISDREVQLLRRLAPHLRRAVIISNLIDIKSIEAEALGHTLDVVPAGVVLLAEDAEILHANRAASRMIDVAAPIRSARGKLSVADSRTAARLRQVVAAAARNEARIGGAGIAMALNGHAGPPATAHVLPIAAGALRSRLKGAVAVFIVSDGHQPPLNLAPVAEAFGLSRAETRVLDRLVEGNSLSEAAAALHIAPTTAKTHLSHLFAKTGTQRQASLIALVNRLAPQVAPPGG